LEENQEICDAQRTAWMEKHCTSAEFVALIDECVSHCTPMVSLKGSVGLLTSMLSSVDREVNALKTDVTKCSRQIVRYQAVGLVGAVPPSSVHARPGKQVNLHSVNSEQKTTEEELTKGGIFHRIFERVKAILLTSNTRALSCLCLNNDMTPRASEQMVDKEDDVDKSKCGSETTETDPGKAMEILQPKEPSTDAQSNSGTSESDRITSVRSDNQLRASEELAAEFTMSAEAPVFVPGQSWCSPGAGITPLATGSPAASGMRRAPIVTLSPDGVMTTVSVPPTPPRPPLPVFESEAA
jgi:hypothetical protein